MKSVLFFNMDYSEEIATKTFCLPVDGETFLPEGLLDEQVSITMSKCIYGRLKPFRYSLLVYTEFMEKTLIQ